MLLIETHRHEMDGAIQEVFSIENICKKAYRGLLGNLEQMLIGKNTLFATLKFNMDVTWQNSIEIRLCVSMSDESYTIYGLDENWVELSRVE